MEICCTEVHRIHVFLNFDANVLFYLEIVMTVSKQTTTLKQLQSASNSGVHLCTNVTAFVRMLASMFTGVTGMMHWKQTGTLFTFQPRFSVH